MCIRADGWDQQGEEQDDSEVGGEKRNGFLDGGRFQADIVQVHARDELREDVVFDLGQALPPHQERADAFEAAGGRAAAAADHGNPEEQRDRDGRPQTVVPDRESGGRHEGSRLERRVAERPSDDGHGFDEVLFRIDMVRLP